MNLLANIIPAYFMLYSSVPKLFLKYKSQIRRKHENNSFPNHYKCSGLLRGDFCPPDLQEALLTCNSL